MFFVCNELELKGFPRAAQYMGLIPSLHVEKEDFDSLGLRSSSPSLSVEGFIKIISFRHYCPRHDSMLVKETRSRVSHLEVAVGMCGLGMPGVMEGVIEGSRRRNHEPTGGGGRVVRCEPQSLQRGTHFFQVRVVPAKGSLKASQSLYHSPEVVSQVELHMSFLELVIHDIVADPILAVSDALPTVSSVLIKL
jgi:hypothetical protein